MRKVLTYLLVGALALACTLPLYSKSKRKMSPEARTAQKRAKARQKALKKQGKAKQKERKRQQAHRR